MSTPILSVTGPVRNPAAVRKDVWTVCRGYSELDLPNDLTLLQWAERGRVLSAETTQATTATTERGFIKPPITS